MNTDEVLYIIIVVVSSMSALGSLFVIILYNKFESLQIFAFKLVYILSIFDFLLAIFSIIPTPLYISADSQLCIVQGLFIELLSLAGVLWTGAIALILYMQVILQNPQVNRHLNRILIAILAFSIICSAIPLISNDYVYIGAWCGINYRNERGVIYRYALFYFWVWLVIVLELYAYFRVIFKIKAELTINNSFLHEGRVLVNRLRWYPVILVVCYAPLTIMRIVQTINSHPPVWFLFFSTALSNLLGFFNALVYGLNESVKIEIRSIKLGRTVFQTKLHNFSDSYDEYLESFS